jgi:integrase
MRDHLERTPFNKPGVRRSLIPAEAEDNKRRRRLSEAEEARLMTAAAPLLKLLITAALYSGMRRGEMLSLTWDDLDARPGWIRLRGDTTKSGKTRFVPVLPKVQAVFDFLRNDANGDQKPETCVVFSNEVGEPICDFRTAWTNALRRAEIRDYRWHDLRHEFASRLAELGVPMVQVRDLLGHASVVTTERYETQHDERLKAAVEKLAEPKSEPPADEQPAGVSQSLHTEQPGNTDHRSVPTRSALIS